MKASPGAWILQLREGKSRDIYEIRNAIDSEDQNKDHIITLIDNFLGKTIRIRVSKQSGKEKLNLLSDSADTNQDSSSSIFDTSDEEESNPIWSTITKFVYYLILVLLF